MLHIPPTNCLLLTAKQEPYKKAYLLTKNIEDFFWKKSRRKGQQTENDKTERVIGLGRRTREEIAKWNQMTALRFQTGGGETSDIPGLPSGADFNEFNTRFERVHDNIVTTLCAQGSLTSTSSRNKLNVCTIASSPLCVHRVR